MKPKAITIFILFTLFLTSCEKYDTCNTCYARGEITQSETCSNCKGRGQMFCRTEKTWGYSWLGGGGRETSICNDGKQYCPRGLLSTKICYGCNGSRYRNCSTCDGYGTKKTVTNCYYCGGNGRTLTSYGKLVNNMSYNNFADFSLKHWWQILIGGILIMGIFAGLAELVDRYEKFGIAIFFVIVYMIFMLATIIIEIIALVRYL